MNVTIGIKKLSGKEDLPIPKQMTIGSAGADIAAGIDEDIIIQPLQRKLIPTGMIFEIPPGYEVQIRPRSGLALKHGITVLNTPGTIDSDYRGEIGVILINLGQEAFRITRGLRIAQAVAAPQVSVNYIECESPTITRRGTGGFGHTGEAN
ncbi:MAG: dUTP diphosphatase [Fibrobacterota bacterium]